MNSLNKKNKVVPGEELVVGLDLDVEEGVAHAEEGVRVGHVGYCCWVGEEREGRAREEIRKGKKEKGGRQGRLKELKYWRSEGNRTVARKFEFCSHSSPLTH